MEDWNEYFINRWDKVKVFKCGHIVEMSFVQGMNDKATILRIDGDHYIVVGTGEIKEVKHWETRADGVGSVRETMKRLRRLINANFCGGDNELFVTLTYADNMQDVDRLYEDFRRFMQRFRYKFGACEYICCVEPQARGAWHCHVLVRFDGREYVYIANSEVADVWGHGYTSTRRLYNVDNVGAYVTAYLTNLVVGEGEEAVTIKGRKLEMYPAGVRIYRRSKGIVDPEVERMDYVDFRRLVGKGERRYRGQYIGEWAGSKHVIIREEWNLRG